MQGKILGARIISSDDGNRYTCGKSDFKNLNGKDFNSLSGVEVILRLAVMKMEIKQQKIFSSQKVLV